MIQKSYEIRQAVLEDVSLLPEIERRAARLFDAYLEETGLTDSILAHVNSTEDLERARQAGHLWVAVSPEGEVVGFALVLEIGGYAHLDELDVLPSHGRRGTGSALLDKVCSWARDSGYCAVTLRTFRDIPWNGPFYRRRGFRDVDSTELSAKHIELEAAEKQRGMRTDLRVSMKCPTVGRD